MTENNCGLPFGELDCETEVLRGSAERYEELYFSRVPFTHEALRRETYLIIGRRGSGKTALTQYFSFQQDIPNCRAMVIDQHTLFAQVLAAMEKLNVYSENFGPDDAAKIWENIIWTIILNEYRDAHPAIERANRRCKTAGGSAQAVRLAIQAMLDRIQDDVNSQLMIALDRWLNSPVLASAKTAVLDILDGNPFLLSLDTSEHYNPDDIPTMLALAGLVQCVADFNRKFDRNGLLVKLFLPDEIFPHLKTTYVDNSLKKIRNPVYLRWRPRDLLRLICWRYHWYLRERGILDKASVKIDWTSFDDVIEKMWYPYFGKMLESRIKLKEPSLIYVFRHTHMRPRQLILLCNSIAKLAIKDGTFPYFEPQHIREGIREGEQELAGEIINSYSRIYPNLDRILDGLHGVPAEFQGQQLDKAAARSASQWIDGTYNQLNFRYIVCQLGIVGRVRFSDARFIQADFEYNMPGRLAVSEEDQCVIHPMFCEYFNSRMTRRTRVLPWPRAGDSEYDLA